MTTGQPIEAPWRICPVFPVLCNAHLYSGRRRVDAHLNLAPQLCPSCTQLQPNPLPVRNHTTNGAVQERKGTLTLKSCCASGSLPAASGGRATAPHQTIMGQLLCQTAGAPPRLLCNSLGRIERKPCLRRKEGMFHYPRSLKNVRHISLLPKTRLQAR